MRARCALGRCGLRSERARCALLALRCTVGVIELAFRAWDALGLVQRVRQRAVPGRARPALGRIGRVDDGPRSARDVYRQLLNR